MDGRRRLAWFALLAPAFAAGLTHCTFDGLNALGAGSPDGSGSSESGSSQPPGADASTMDADATSQGDDVESGGPAPGADAAPEAAMEASTSVPDAAPEASSAPPTALPVYLDGGTASWCDQHPGYAFCADFDRTPLPAGFTTSDGAYLIQTSSIASSAPNDLLVLVPAMSGAGSWGSKLSRSFNTPVTSVTLAFDVYPEIVSTGGFLFAALDFVDNANAKYSVRLAYNQGAPRLEESYLGSPPDVYHSNFVVTPQTYSRVQMELTFPPQTDGGFADAGAATETIYVDGVLQRTPEALAPPAGFDPSPNLLIGAVFGSNPTGAWAIRYDNVTLDIQ